MGVIATGVVILFDTIELRAENSVTSGPPNRTNRLILPKCRSHRARADDSPKD